MSSSSPLGIGLLGAASISTKSWGAIHRAGHRVISVGCRDSTRGGAFVKKCADFLSIPEELRPTVCTYEATISNPDVHVVYIPLPVTHREKWVLLCAEKGKHVVGEKPPAENAEQLQEWLKVIHDKGLLYMDGTMLSHGKRVYAAAEEAKQLGALNHMTATFCFDGGEEIFKDIRADPTLEPTGAVGDLGWYCIRYMLHFTNFALPTSVSGHYKHRTDSGAIMAFHASLEFPHGVSASIFVSFLSANEQTFTASYQKGVVRVDDLTLPFAGDSVGYTVSTHNIVPNGTSLSYNKVTTDKTVEGEDSTYQETQLWRDVGQALVVEESSSRLVAVKEHQQRWADMSLKTQLVVDKLVVSAAKGGAFVSL